MPNIKDAAKARMAKFQFEKLTQFGSDPSPGPVYIGGGDPSRLNWVSFLIFNLRRITSFFNVIGVIIHWPTLIQKLGIDTLIMISFCHPHTEVRGLSCFACFREIKCKYNIK